MDTKGAGIKQLISILSAVFGSFVIPILRMDLYDLQAKEEQPFPTGLFTSR